jgi:hypothetical protein
LGPKKCEQKMNVTLLLVDFVDFPPLAAAVLFFYSKSRDIEFRFWKTAKTAGCESYDRICVGAGNGQCCNTD